MAHSDRRYDVVEFYFVIDTSKGHQFIQAWSDDKELAKAYMEFHGKKGFTIRRVEDTLESVNRLVDENINSEITLYNGVTRGSNPDKPWEMVDVIIPMTKAEIMLINEERQEFMGSAVAYSQLNDMFPFLKDKYKRALRELYLEDVIKCTVHNRTVPGIEQIQFDDVRMLFKFFNDTFH